MPCVLSEPEGICRAEGKKRSENKRTQGIEKEKKGKRARVVRVLDYTCSVVLWGGCCILPG